MPVGLDQLETFMQSKLFSKANLPVIQELSANSIKQFDGQTQNFINARKGIKNSINNRKSVNRWHQLLEDNVKENQKIISSAKNSPSKTFWEIFFSEVQETVSTMKDKPSRQMLNYLDYLIQKTPVIKNTVLNLQARHKNPEFTQEHYDLHHAAYKYLRNNPGDFIRRQKKHEKTPKTEELENIVMKASDKEYEPANLYDHINYSLLQLDPDFSDLIKSCQTTHDPKGEILKEVWDYKYEMPGPVKKFLEGLTKKDERVDKVHRKTIENSTNEKMTSAFKAGFLLRNLDLKKGLENLITQILNTSTPIDKAVDLQSIPRMYKKIEEHIEKDTNLFFDVLKELGHPVNYLNPANHSKVISKIKSRLMPVI